LFHPAPHNKNGVFRENLNTLKSYEFLQLRNQFSRIHGFLLSVSSSSGLGSPSKSDENSLAIWGI
jgi:hypothetical protein